MQALELQARIQSGKSCITEGLKNNVFLLSVEKGRMPKVCHTYDWELAPSLAESAVKWAFWEETTFSQCSGVSGSAHSNLKSTVSKALGGCLSTPQARGLVPNKEVPLGANPFPLQRAAHPDNTWSPLFQTSQRQPSVHTQTSPWSNWNQELPEVIGSWSSDPPSCKRQGIHKTIREMRWGF